MRSKFLSALTACALVSVFSLVPRADTLPAQALPFSQNWSNIGLITTSDDWSGVPGVVGYRGDGLTSSTGVDPQTVLAEGGLVVDVNANQTNPNTFTTGGVTEFHLANPVVALQGSGTASAPHIVATVSTFGLTNIHVAYNLRDIDGSADNSVQPVALQFRVGLSGSYTNIPAGFVADASSGPSLATLVTPVNVELPTSADNRAVVQIRIITTDAVGSDEWIGIDDLSVTGTGTPGDAPPEVAFTAPASGAIRVPIDSSVGITFTESVNAGASAFAMSCAGSPQAFAQSASPSNAFTLTPTSPLPYNTTCSVTVTAAQITETDGSPAQMASDAVFSFTTAINSVVVISQLYGGGGNSGAVYHNDFIELYNRGTATVDLAGWSVQYASATGSTWGKQTLGGTIAPGEYYLIALGSNDPTGTIGAPLPAANIDATSNGFNMSATTGKVALVDNSVDLTGGCPITTSVQVQDFVGYGTANCREGTTNAPGPTNPTAILRLASGATDTDRNNADFAVGAPNPRRTAPFIEVGPSVASTDPTTNATAAPRDATIEVAFSEPVDVTGSWFDITCLQSGAHNIATFASFGLSRYITPNVGFLEGERCTVTIYKDQVTDQDTDDSAPNTDTLAANYVWSFTVATGTPPPYPPSVHLTMGNPTGAIASISQPNNYLMEKPEYALSYNAALSRPNWVSWHLSDEWVGTLTRMDTFRPDPAVPPDWYRVQSFDFSGSGFDRGHMTPNADRDKETSIPINQATFLMSNMVAQAPDNNQGPWASLENYLRSLLPNDELYIVAGGAGEGGFGSNGGVTTTLAGGYVSVPASTWKVALVLPKDGGDDISRVTCSTRTIAVLMPNIQGIRTNTWETYLTTVDAVETLTGYNLFSNLPEPIQQCVEAGIDGHNPPGDQVITFDASPDHTYGDPAFSVTATGGYSGNPVTFAASGACSSGGVNGATITIVSGGACAITASQAGSVIDNFNAATAVTRTLTVNKATASISVTGYSGVYDGAAHGATGSATGVGGADLSGLLHLGATFTNVPGGTAHWTFDGNSNYTTASGDAPIAIAMATPAFSALDAPTIEAGSATVSISGTLSLGLLAPTGSVTVSLGAGSVSAAIGANGRFTATLPAATLTVANSPYAIGFSYGGDTNFTAAADSSTLRVTDTTGPVITGVTTTPGSLGPPNHKMIAVFVGYTANDVSGAPTCSLSVSSNEPVNGVGDGNTSIDWQVLDPHHVQLRAERSGTGNGRLYTITIRCTDTSGNTSISTGTVGVPK